MADVNLLDLMLGAPVAPSAPPVADATQSTPEPVPSCLGPVEREIAGYLDARHPVYDVQDYDGRHVSFSWDRDTYRHVARADRISTP